MALIFFIPLKQSAVIHRWPVLDGYTMSWGVQGVAPRCHSPSSYRCWFAVKLEVLLSNQRAASIKACIKDAGHNVPKSHFLLAMLCFHPLEWMNYCSKKKVVPWILFFIYTIERWHKIILKWSQVKHQGCKYSVFCSRKSLVNLFLEENPSEQVCVPNLYPYPCGQNTSCCTPTWN